MAAVGKWQCTYSHYIHMYVYKFIVVCITEIGIS